MRTAYFTAFFRDLHAKIVIGAGVSGLACAAELVKAGHAVLVLEARDRIGGRAHTIEDPAVKAPFDLGARLVYSDYSDDLTLSYARSQASSMA